MDRRLYVFETQMGWVAIVGSRELISRLTLPRPSREEAASHALGGGGGDAVESPNDFSGECGRIRRYFAGHPVTFSCELDISAHTPFRRAVWSVVRGIPYAETRTYQWVAEQTGRIRGARAVGQALGSNPVPVIVPCHRVVQSDGCPGGFSLGSRWKRILLEMEQGQRAVQR